ncbi:MAG TPA: tyrosine-type recombinase/integrase [Solirubrobacterales bacterium]|nr:tyrosine-type recombinase/integrase [Solirubrobacterales bacterium]
MSKPPVGGGVGSSDRSTAPERRASSDEEWRRHGKADQDRDAGDLPRPSHGLRRKGRCDCPYTVITRHRGKPKKETVVTLGKAREIKGRRDSGDRAPTPTIRFGTYYEGWIETYAGRTSQGFSGTSRDEYKRVAKKWLLPRWETWKLVEIEPRDVRSLLVEMREAGASTSEIKKTRTAGSAMYGTATEDDGIVRSNPFLGVRIPPPPEEDEDEVEEKAKALSREELGWLLAALPDEHRLFFEFLTHSGLRISEAAGLRWEHVDISRRRLRVREQVYRGKRKKLKSKTGKRDLPLSPRMADRLLAHRASTYEGEKASVFPSEGKLRKTKDGFAFPFDSKALAREVLIPTRQALGLDWVTFHTFRHTCASMLFARGRNIKQVGDWLGHADPAFTLRTYVHLLDAGVGDADFFDDEIAAQGNARATRGPKKAASPSTIEPVNLAA